ncbi:hypothetical protein FUT79_06620 [Treponema phagedenis]|nr:hypothetical protein FUT79_06620 [Treponema phagedenis]QEK05820.1 hypothetical protein FUT80_03190 [Treponema phagedenis]
MSKFWGKHTVEPAPAAYINAVLPAILPKFENHLLPMVSLVTVAKFKTMFCLILQRKQAKLVGEVTVNFQNFTIVPCCSLSLVKKPRL